MKCILIKKSIGLVKKLILSLSCFFVIFNAQADAFDDGTVTGVLAISNASLLNENYTILGLGAGYFVANGIQLGVDASIWTGGSASVYEVTPKITYVYKNSSVVSPYVGMFYNRTFIEGFDDSNSLGYRLGFYSPVGSNAYLGIGGVYSELQDCNEAFYSKCSSSYTEFSVIFSF